MRPTILRRLLYRPALYYSTTTTTCLQSSFSSKLSPSIHSPPAYMASSKKDDDHSSYEQWVRRLYMTNLFHPVKMGLQNIEKLHQVLGNPMDDKVSVIHIAGTNGKGSVALKIAKTLEAAYPDQKVGLFCSPHVSSFRERMQVNGDLITEEEVVQLMPEIYRLCEVHDIPATFFEITTALAFAFFEARKTNFVVLETGLGGRLDATNVIQQPRISIITSIGLEHTRILGDTIELIAKEKAGIMKTGRPVVVGPQCPHAVMRECATEKKAGPYYEVDEVIPVTAEQRESELKDYDLENSRIVRAALTVLRNLEPERFAGVTEEAIKTGTSQRPSCRFEEIVTPEGQTVILDVAHNPPAMEYLARKLDKQYPGQKVRVVVGMSSDKDLKLSSESVKQIVSGDQSRIHLVEAFHPRAAKVKDIIAATSFDKAHFDLDDPSITKQLGIARALAAERNELLVVCGSVFLMAEAREALGIDEPRDSDYIAEVAGANLRYGQENFGNSGAAEDSKVKN